MQQSGAGNFFEDFRLGAFLHHGPPRTVCEADAAIHGAIYGNRFGPQAARTIALKLGLDDRPLDDFLTFHLVFGKSVPTISLNAVANLGYAEGRFLRPLYKDETISAQSEVIGLKENSDGKTGVVYVRTTGLDAHDAPVLTYVRWVMVRKRHPDRATGANSVPELDTIVSPSKLIVPAPVFPQLPAHIAGSGKYWNDYKTGERIDHTDGVTVEEAEHMLATRLYHNTARVHFNQHAEAGGRFGKRIVYGGHVISIARALSFNGLENAWFVTGLNGGRHVAPCFAGDTVYAWSEVTQLAECAGRPDAGFLRLRTFATKNRECSDYPGRSNAGTYDPSVILDLDYWVAMPRSTQPNRTK